MYVSFHLDLSSNLSDLLKTWPINHHFLFFLTSPALPVPPPRQHINKFTSLQLKNKEKKNTWRPSSYPNISLWQSNIFPLLQSKEKAMAPHSSTLAWKIPWTEEPGRLQSMGSLGVGHDWVTSLSLFTFMHWRRKWQPTPVFLPGESQGQGSLVGCRLWGRTESDMTEAT